MKIGFIIDKDGSIKDATVVESLSPDQDVEALRIVNLMPDWIPAVENGKFVKVQFFLPIKFSAR